MNQTIIWLDEHKDSIWANLKPESINVYQFLKQRVKDKNHTTGHF